MEEYARLDEDVQTSLDDTLVDPDQPSTSSDRQTTDEDEGPEEIPEEEVQRLDNTTAASYARLLMRYCLTNDLPQRAEMLTGLQEDIQKRALKAKTEQPQRTISSFFKAMPKN